MKIPTLQVFVKAETCLLFAFVKNETFPFVKSKPPDQNMLIFTKVKLKVVRFLTLFAIVLEAQ